MSQFDENQTSDFFALSQSIGRLDGKVDLLLALNGSQKETTDDHEVRIRQLEKSSWRQAAFIGGISASVSAFITYINKIGVFPT